MTASGVARHRALQLFVLLVGLWQVPGVLPSPQEEGWVPVSQQKVLSLSLAHLLHGVEEISRHLEQHEGEVEAEVVKGNRSLGRLQKKSMYGGRIYRQVRKDLQILSAKKDKLHKELQELRDIFANQDQEQEVMEQRLTQILQHLNSLAELRPAEQLDLGAIKVIIGKQARRLAHLSFKVSAQTRVVDRHGLQIQQLEKKVPAAERRGSN